MPRRVSSSSSPSPAAPLAPSAAQPPRQGHKATGAGAASGWSPSSKVAAQARAAATKRKLPKLAAPPPPLKEPTLRERLAALPEAAKRGLATLGLTPADVVAAGADAAPCLLLAAQAVGQGQPDQAVEHLLAAGPAAIPLVLKASQALAQKLPEGAPRALLSNQEALVAFMQDQNLHAAVVAVFRPESRMEGLRVLLDHEVSREAVLGAIGADPTVEKWLGRLGLSSNALLEVGRAAGPLWDSAVAFNAGQTEDGLAALAWAVESTPELGGRAVQVGLDRLPSAARRKLEALGLTGEDLYRGAAALPSLYAAAHCASAKDYAGLFANLSQASVPAGPAVQKVLASLARKLPEGPARAVLADPYVLAATVSDPVLHGAIAQLFTPETRTAGLRQLVTHDASREAVLYALAGDPKVQGMLAKVGLTPDELPQLGRLAPAAWMLVEGVQAGDFVYAAQVLVDLKAQAPDLAARLGRAVEKVLPAPVKRGLDALGLGGYHLVELGAALPALIGAGQLAAAGDVRGALTALGDAAISAPDMVARAIGAVAAKLPGTGLIKSMLTDPAVVGQLVGSRDFHDTLRGLLAGDLNALRALSTNQALGSPIAQRLWENPTTRSRLSKLGFDSSWDVAQGFSGLAAAMDVAERAQAKDYRGAVDALGSVAAALPDGLRRKVTSRLTQALKLPPGLANVLVEGGLALTDPTVRRALGDATSKVMAGDVRGFLQALAATGVHLSTMHPAAAASFLDALQNLPGSMGRLFKDPELNRMLVESGSVAQVFLAAQRLAEGQPAEAAREVGRAIAALAGAGAPYTVSDYQLPVMGQDGAQAMAKLFERVVDALPAQAKARVVQRAAQLAAKSGMSFVPVLGPAMGAMGEAKEIVEGLRRTPPDYIAVAVDGAQLVLEVAALYPPAQPFVRPVTVGLGFLETALDAKTLVDDVRAFQREFTGLTEGGAR